MLIRADLNPIAIALLAYLVDFLLRSVRFWLLLEAVTARRLPFRFVPAPFVASFGISDLLPLRAGDVFRLVWFQRHFSLRTANVFSAMAIERFYDLTSLILLGTILASLRLPLAIGLCLTSAVALTLVLAPLILGRVMTVVPVRTHESDSLTLQRRISDALREVANGFTVLKSSVRVVMLSVLSLLCWLLEAILFLGAWNSLGGALSMWQAPMAAFTASTLGTLVPGLPGHFGTFELFGLEAFTRSGISADRAAAVLLLAHLLLWAPTALFAMIWLPFGRLTKATEQPDGLLPQG